ncbi:sulfite exporter TauE/SafE family protein [Vibrio agarivorans]|uniref:Probable membrane transporter protein n=1 Tax=Vibrio agarivorans TaxID=153622 RepID=A0ABT7Y141_9VIBR|nr:sulfite exporter TauE/SafE family protein [Vibrio agarivorans]MDN2481746.1 sulfite exporter TauE/SafE family protein [Vibrio agarivorans]
MDWFDSALLFIGSLIANTLASMSGGGAGLLQFPLLIFFGLPFSEALATHKVASVALGLGAAYTHLRAKTVSIKIMAFVILTGSVGVIAGAWLVVMIPEERAQTLLGLMIIALGLYSRFKPSLGTETEEKHRDVYGYLLGAFGLAIIGVINGSLTAGSGLLVTLFLVQWFGFSYKQAVALTMICVGLFWNGLGGVAVAQAGAPIFWPWLPLLLGASFLGGGLGAHIATKKSNVFIKRCFEVLTFLVGIKLLF